MPSARASPLVLRTFPHSSTQHSSNFVPRGAAPARPALPGARCSGRQHERAAVALPPAVPLAVDPDGAQRLRAARAAAAAAAAAVVAAAQAAAAQAAAAGAGCLRSIGAGGGGARAAARSMGRRRPTAAGSGGCARAQWMLSTRPGAAAGGWRSSGSRERTRPRDCSLLRGDRRRAGRARRGSGRSGDANQPPIYKIS